MQCVFDGTIYVNATMVNSQEITCISPPHAVGKVPVQTTVYGDAQKSISEPVYFTYIQRPKVISIDPPCGPVNGMTQIKVVGENFVSLGPNMAYCLFNNTHYMNVTIIDSQTLFCSTPKLPTNERSLPAERMFYNVSVTVDKLSTHSLEKVNFGYYFDSELSSVENAVGPVTGGTVSTLHGKGFTHPNVCKPRVRYGALEVTPSSINATFITAVAPMVNLPGPVVLATSGNGQNYADDITLHYRDKENTFTYNQEVFVNYLHPQNGPTRGNTKVNVGGVGFVQNRNDDFTPDLSHPIWYRTLTESGVQIGNVAKVNDLTSELFTWRTPPCPQGTKQITLQLSWDQQTW